LKFIVGLGRLAFNYAVIGFRSENILNAHNDTQKTVKGEANLLGVFAVLLVIVPRFATFPL
jgi:hypothetical protein